MPRDGVIVGLAGLTASAVLVVAGVSLHRRAPPGRRLGVVIVVLGLVGLAASAGWLILGAYIDAVTR
ncbi:MAG TPA: hypothetical protein VLA87_11105 [Gaiellaceae bacterium]|nr:hypothetical protein [Gaiellaceae bacterium]